MPIDFIRTNFPDRSKKVIAFHPAAGKKANIWDLKNFIELIKKLYKKYNNYVLITSGWTDEEIVGQICTELTIANIEYKILHNESVKKLGAILSMIDLYITNDTGTMHIAGYSGAKIISLFGPTNPAEWAPIGENQKFIKSASGDINNISVDEVFALAETFLFDNKN